MRCPPLGGFCCFYVITLLSFFLLPFLYAARFYTHSGVAKGILVLCSDRLNSSHFVTHGARPWNSSYAEAFDFSTRPRSTKSRLVLNNDSLTVSVSGKTIYSKIVELENCE